MLAAIEESIHRSDTIDVILNENSHERLVSHHGIHPPPVTCDLQIAQFCVVLCRFGPPKRDPGIRRDRTVRGPPQNRTKHPISQITQNTDHIIYLLVGPVTPKPPTRVSETRFPGLGPLSRGSHPPFRALPRAQTGEKPIFF